MRVRSGELSIPCENMDEGGGFLLSNLHRIFALGNRSWQYVNPIYWREVLAKGYIGKGLWVGSPSDEKDGGQWQG